MTALAIPNPLRMNDWGIKRFLIAVISLQLAFWGSLFLEPLNIHIPLFREIISLGYLLYVPGILILRILKLHKLGAVEALLYSFGLSIAVVMFTGIVINTIYPLFGVTNPISLGSLVVSFSTLILFLSFISYLRDREYSNPDFINARDFLSPTSLLFFLLPLISVLGIELVNSTGNNIFLLVMITIVGAIIILIGFEVIISNKLFPLAVYAITVSIVLHRSMASAYVSGTDIHLEYFVANLVNIAGRWNPTDAFFVNGCLPVTMLAPITSLVSGISLTMVFKGVIPVLFSLAPLGLYKVFQKQTDERTAALSAFFLVSVFSFWSSNAVVVRQSIGILFIVFLLLLMTDRKVGGHTRAFLFSIFGASLAVSHYTMSYIYISWLIFAWITLSLLDIPKVHKVANDIYAKIAKPITFSDSDDKGQRTISLTFIVLLIAFAFTWYIYIAHSVAFKGLESSIFAIVKNAITEFLNPAASEGLSMLSGTRLNRGLLHLMDTLTMYLNQIFLIIGVFVLFFKYREMKFEKEYTAFSIISLGIILAGILVPFLSIAVNMERLYYIGLIVLAPFCIVGAITVFKLITQIVKVPWTTNAVKMSFKVLSIYFVIFFFFQIGFIWQLTQGYSGDISLSRKGIEKYGTLEQKAFLYNAFTPVQDVFSAKWIAMNMNGYDSIYAVYYDQSIHTLDSYGMIPSERSGLTPSKIVVPLTKQTNRIPKDAYVYLQYMNVVEGVGTEFNSLAGHGNEHSTYNITELYGLYKFKNKIYSNDGSEVYK